MKNNILIIGGTGLLGSELYRCFSEENDVTIASEAMESEFLAPKEFKGGWVYLDVTDKESIEKVVGAKKYDIIFLLAAIIDTSSSRSINSEDLLYRVNMKGTSDVLEVIARLASDAKLVFSSSMTVYSPFNESPVKEDAKVAPVHAYGIYKRRVEDAIEDHCLKGNMKAVVVRFPGLFGVKRKNGYIYNITQRALRGDEVLIEPGNMVYWETMDVVDAANSLESIIKNYKWDKNCKVLNVGYGEETDFVNTAHMICDKLSSKSDIKVLGKPAYRLFYMSNDKYIALVGGAVGNYETAIDRYLKDVK